MQKKITLPIGEYLVVSVPKESKFHTLIESHSYMKSPRVEHSIGGVDLPIDYNYELIGLASQITEEQAREIVNKPVKIPTDWDGGEEDYYFDFLSKEPFYNTALESFHSLLKANGIEAEDALILKVKK